MPTPTLKTHAVVIGGKTYYAKAQTKAGAIKLVSAALHGDATAEVATEDQLIEIGRKNLPVIGGEQQLDMLNGNNGADPR